MNNYSSPAGMGNPSNTMNIAENTANVSTVYVCGSKFKKF